MVGSERLARFVTENGARGTTTVDGVGDVKIHPNFHHDPEAVLRALNIILRSLYFEVCRTAVASTSKYEV